MRSIHPDRFCVSQIAVCEWMAELLHVSQVGICAKSKIIYSLGAQLFAYHFRYAIPLGLTSMRFYHIKHYLSRMMFYKLFDTMRCHSLE